jgi:hypothetical protein
VGLEQMMMNNGQIPQGKACRRSFEEIFAVQFLLLKYSIGQVL